MSVVVSVLGVIAVMAGLASFGFGLTIKEFSFGSTLMISGMTALIGGLLLIALAAAIRELNRIGTILASRQRFARPGEAQEAHGFVPAGVGAVGAPRMVPVPVPAAYEGSATPVHETPGPKPAAAVAAVDLMQEVPASEPVEPETPVHETAAYAEPKPVEPEPDLAQVEGADVQVAAAEIAAIEETAAREPAEPETEPEPEPVSSVHERERFAWLSQDSLRDEVIARAEREPEEQEPEQQPVSATDQAEERRDIIAEVAAAKPEPEDVPAERKRLLPFDAIWPPSERSSAHRAAQTRTEMPSTVEHREESAERHDEDDVQAASSEAPAIAPSDEPEAGWPHGHEREPESEPVREQEAAAEAEEPAAAEQAPEPPHAVSILKSGTVDGMGYALYSDGSIEAELPSGTIRFASIQELREHLEKVG